ncbi:MAG: enoyl-CoA hydratase/isomerase family protein [Myxococcota bacterium]
MSELVAVSTSNRVTTVRFNHPKRLNGWTLPMQDAFRAALDIAAEDDTVDAVILTGTGKYYSAGVDLGGSFKLGHPRELRAMIFERNRALFDLFITFPKPMVAAVNGRAIGAPVTTAALCDRLIAAEEASFLTPFARVGLPAEGCSSVQFPRIMGEAAAERMLGAEGFEPSAAEALEMGLVHAVVSADALQAEAQRVAESLSGKTREFRAGATREELLEINTAESHGVADGFLSSAFLMNQFKFMRSRKKTVPALTFLALRVTRPAWSLLL